MPKPIVVSDDADNTDANGGAITPDLVQQVADKVYTMWLRDLQLEWERQRFDSTSWFGDL